MPDAPESPTSATHVNYGLLVKLAQAIRSSQSPSLTPAMRSRYKAQSKLLGYN